MDKKKQADSYNFLRPGSVGLSSQLGVFETHPSDEKIKLVIDQYKQIKREYEQLKEIFEKRLLEERINTIAIFSIFTAFVAFMSAEINIFSGIKSYWLIVGLSLMLISFILLFILAARNIAVNTIQWKDFFSPLITFLLVLLLLGSFVIESHTEKITTVTHSEIKYITQADLKHSRSNSKNNKITNR